MLGKKFRKRHIKTCFIVIIFRENWDVFSSTEFSGHRMLTVNVGAYCMLITDHISISFSHPKGYELILFNVQCYTC